MDTSTETRGEHEGHEGHEVEVPVDNKFVVSCLDTHYLRKLARHPDRWILLRPVANALNFDFLLLRALRVHPGVSQ
jgi:hypothetical protein